MNEPNADAIAGIVDFLILSTLSVGPMESFSIEQRVQRRVGRFFEVRPGSVSAALQRMERSGRVAVELRQAEKLHKEKFYSLTGAGREQLDAELARWTSELARFVEEGKGFVQGFWKMKPNSWN